MRAMTSVATQRSTHTEHLRKGTPMGIVVLDIWDAPKLGLSVLVTVLGCLFLMEFRAITVPGMENQWP